MKTQLSHFVNIISKLCIILFAFSHQSHASSNQTIVTAINERLSYMEAVAAYKWLAGIPIEDLNREKKVLESAARSGLDQNIKVESSKHFFALQIQAAKEIQRYWFNQWQVNGTQPFPPEDLNTVIRPALIELGQLITSQLVNPDAALHLTTQDINVAGLSQETAQRLQQAALRIEQYDNTLEQVLGSGILRVGTTFDYEPFSARDENTQAAVGIDITLAKDLARSLDATLELVPTSWPTLMADLAAGQYDVGMSGISINLKRHRTAFFSEPYQTGGKTPIIRCADQKAYRSLEDIDQRSNTVVVNPGGTNEKFARANIEQATLNLHNDNRTIFQEIIENRADAMITDAIEVEVQSNRHPELCAAMPGATLTFSQKAFLLPQDAAWKHYIDTWLKQRTGDGTVERVFSQHLSK